MKGNRLQSYLTDPFLRSLFDEIKCAGAMKSSLIDITHKCNLRCVGCYYFVENMDQYKRVESDEEFIAFVESEVQRGTNMLTVVGGEPALEIERLRILARHFKLTVVTNGSIPIPKSGLEHIRIAISFWGDEQQDVLLRGGGKHNIFATALQHFKDDDRVGFYYTTLPGYVDGIAAATEKMVRNGNFVAYNFYADLAQKGGDYSHSAGFSRPIQIINEMAQRYPTRVITSPHINETISHRSLFGKPWGYEQCPSVTFDHPQNAERMKYGKKYPTQFRAYNSDLRTTRRCCIGSARDCDTCTDLWATYGWIIGSLKDHLKTPQDFTHWLLTTYIFYMQTGFIDWNENAYKLPTIYQRFAIKARPAQKNAKRIAALEI